MTDDLDRFVRAQDPVLDRVLAELRAGRKTSHWMWFVFPQLRGLGRSGMAYRYGVASITEARAYLAHPLLAPRLRTCLDLLHDITDPDPARVFGPLDALKLRSSLTLFAEAGSGSSATTLHRWFAGPDPATLALLAR